MASTNDLKNGMVLDLDGQLWQVLWLQGELAERPTLTPPSSTANTSVTALLRAIGCKRMSCCQMAPA